MLSFIMQRLVFLSVVMISCIRLTEETNISSHCKFQLTMYQKNTVEERCLYGCESGWYGPLCNKRCSRQCKYSLCRQNDGLCINGCKNGFSTHRICRVTTNYRIKRSSECLKKESQNSSRCVCCSEGYRGDSCNISCENCKTFNRNNRCEYMCSSGHFGNYCNNTCPKICQNGSSGIPICQLESGNFTCSYGCIRGYHGGQCNKLCSKYCEKNICKQDDGICINCSRTFHGTNCTEACNSSCVDRNCYRNGTCVETCPTNCVSGDTTSMTCTINGTDNIQCSNGCVEGYYGLQCDKNCRQNCQVCAHKTGQCRVCNNGRYGQNCHIICGENCLNYSCQAYPDKSDQTYLCTHGCGNGYRGHQCLDIVGSSVGLVVVSVIVVLAALVIVGIIIYKRSIIHERCRHYQCMETTLGGNYSVEEHASNDESECLSVELQKIKPSPERDTKEVNNDEEDKTNADTQPLPS